jgi:hypothetical protein
MLETLPAPEVVRCYFEDSFEPPLPALALHWQPDAASADYRWDLPEDVSIVGPPPRHFGVTLRRRAADTYSVRLVWDRTCLHWQALTRSQLLTSSLLPVLDALGTDLWYLLDQPVEEDPALPDRAA